MPPPDDLAFRARVEEALERDDPSELADLALEIGLEAHPWDWAQSCCVQLARHRSAAVRGSAVAGLGHLARRFGRLDPGSVRRRVEIALHDPSPAVRACARDAADDLRTFLGWEFAPPPQDGGAVAQRGEAERSREGGAGAVAQRGEAERTTTSSSTAR